MEKEQENGNQEVDLHDEEIEENDEEEDITNKVEKK